MNAATSTDATPFKFDLDLSHNALTFEERFEELRDAHAKMQARHVAELAEAKAEGEAMGRASSEAAAAEQLSDHVSKVVKATVDLLKSRDAIHNRLETQASELALSIGRHLAKTALAKHPQDEIEALLKNAIDDLSEVPHLVLHLPKKTAEDVKPMLADLLDEQGFVGRLIIKSELEWTVGDIRLTWGDGELVREFGKAETALRAEITRYFEASA